MVIYYDKLVTELKIVWGDRIGVMVLKTTFKNISVISWRSALLVEETRVPGENQKNTDLPQVTDKFYHIM